MTNQSTIDKLIEMRLTAMADAFRIQMDDSTMKEVPFENRFGMLVDIEYSNRKNNRLKRLIRQAEFEQPDASIAAIDYQSGRKLNKALISRLATCSIDGLRSPDSILAIVFCLTFSFSASCSCVSSRSLRSC